MKPANVMIRKDGHPLILDFGIAREIQETMTRVTGKLSSGTLLYMSPEQLNGDAPKKEQDIYSFAAMAYECLKGEPPFVRGAIEDQIKNKIPEPPVGRDGPITPLAAGIMAGLAKKPEDRPKTCMAVLSEAGFSRVERVERVEGKVSRRGAETQKKSGLGKVIGILALLAALAGGGYYGWLKYGEGAESREAGPGRVAVTNQPPPAVVEPPPVVLPTEGPQTTGATNAPAAGEDLTRLAELRKDIFWKKRSVELRKGELKKYREDPDGLSGKIDEADRLCRSISAAAAASTVSETKKIYARLRDDADAFDRTLAWLSDNKALRDETRKLAGELAALDGDLDRFKAKDLAYAPYAKGMASRKDGKAAFDHGEFAKAKESYSAAKESLEQAVAESRKALVANVLADAKKHLQDEHWEDCIGKCDEALDIDSSNAEAKEMKAQAESNLVPSAKIAILVEGKPLSGVQVKIGRQTWDAPVLWTDITAGKTYGGVDVSFERGGKRYVGNLEEFTVGWKGRKDFKVVLKEYKGPENGDTKTITLPGGATMEMIYVAPGSFTMGSPESEERHEDNEKQHYVTLTKGFWLGKYEVTQKQWEFVMGNNPSNWKGDDLPVDNVSWYDCQDFIRKVNASLNCGARLPTEAEWEYACRAGTTGPYAGGSLDSMGWYGDNSGKETHPHPVGQKQPNPWGFYDMHGNVWEWCNDWYGNYPSGSVTDPMGRASDDGRVLRGGVWYNLARFCRSANRHWSMPGNRYSYYGFRLCCSALP